MKVRQVLIKQLAMLMITAPVHIDDGVDASAAMTAEES